MTGMNAADPETILDAIDRELGRIDHLPELSDERYHESHDDFEAESNQRELILGWFERWADASLQRNDGRVDVLSVGCGGGTIDMRLADVFARHSDSLGLAGVDPNPLHTRAFATCFADRAAEVTVATCPFEAYRSDHRFDVIHFIHCLYYFEQLELALDRAVEMLRPRGWLIVMLAPNGDLNSLADRLWRKQWGRAAWYSADVRPLMQTFGGTVRHKRLDAMLDVAACLDADSEHGRRVLDFIVQADTSRLSPDLQALLRSHLAVISQVDGDRRLAPHPVDVIALQRRE